MRKLFVVAAALVGTMLLADDKVHSKFVVHEWGTFTSMQGSDGVVLEGLYHEEAELPSFVYRRSAQKYATAGIRMKMETPVIYFYSDIERTAQVRVDFPQGVMTQWYPQAFQFGPDLAAEGERPKATGGFLDWQEVSIVPDHRQAEPTPTVPKGDPWNFARETDSAFVRTSWGTKGADEWEKYLFYRGLGTFDLPIEVNEDWGFLVIKNRGDQPIEHAFVLNVDGDKASFAPIPRIEAGTSTAQLKVPQGELSVQTNGKELGKALEDALVADGLYRKEAIAMVRTWEKSYFHTPGTRVLYVVPRAWTEKLLPCTIDPRPDEWVRVLVGRVEVLGREHEKQVAAWVRMLGSDDLAVRDEGTRGLASLGRFAEPNLRRALAQATDPEVKGRCEQLLEQLMPAR